MHEVGCIPKSFQAGGFKKKGGAKNRVVKLKAAGLGGTLVAPPGSSSERPGFRVGAREEAGSS